jgi:hypothetical protein
MGITMDVKIPIYEARALSGHKVQGQLLMTYDHATNPVYKLRGAAYWIVQHATSCGGRVAVGLKYKVKPETIKYLKDIVWVQPPLETH